MSIDTVFHIALYVFLGILFVLQLYFGYRILQSRKLGKSDVTTDDTGRLSRKASFRHALFLATFYIFLIGWAGYMIRARTLPWFLGIAAIITAIVLARKPVAAIRKFRPVAPGFTVDLSIRSTLTDSVTPAYVAAILENEAITRAIKGDLQRTAQIGHKETWRLCLITPDRDKFDPRIFQQSRQEILFRSLQDLDFRSNIQGNIPVVRSAVLHSSTWFNVRLNNIVITEGRRLRSYGLSTRTKRGGFTRLRDIQLHQASARGRSRTLPEFLRESGFPLKGWYADGDPLTAERGGTIVNDRGRISVIYPRYFVQRRLIDDEGNLVYVGLDESLGPGIPFGIEMRPSVSKRLVECVSYNEYTPILRYRSFPFASDFMLPLLDTPMSASGWADLFVDTRGKARLFVAKQRSEAEWYGMMDRLKQLLYNELARHDYHLLGLTKDEAHLNEYLTKKQAILADYFVVQDFTWL